MVAGYPEWDPIVFRHRIAPTLAFSVLCSFLGPESKKNALISI